MEKIRMPLWAELDAYPGLKEAQDVSSDQFEYPLNRIKQVAQFLTDGMTYGWEFTYVPYDKTRKVDEFFEFTEINSIAETGEKITYSDPWIEDNRFNCWVEFDRTPQMIREFRQWQSINFEKIQSHGYGKISDGFDGIKNAAEDCLKNAVRAHYRTIIKNKPKEIRGRVIIRRLPKIGISQGRYVIDLDFFLETTRIIKYSYF